MKIQKSPPIVLTIAGSDPSGGAGIEADLKTFHKHKVYGMALPTLLTVQNTHGVHAIQFLDPLFFAKQWKALKSDLEPDVIKVGAMGSTVMIQTVARLLRPMHRIHKPIILDPVFQSTSGATFLEHGGVQELIRTVFPLCFLITPNTIEFSQLCGEVVTSKNASKLLSRYGRHHRFSILLKGGHFKDENCHDLLYTQGRIFTYNRPRIISPSKHGTGCVLASAIASHLGHGKSLIQACHLAKKFVWNAIRTSLPLGKGNGPLNLI